MASASVRLIVFMSVLETTTAGVPKHINAQT
jgi:hypothetical protein